jgi:hypothetical protein
MKAGARVLGIDDSPFTESDESVLVVGVVWRSGVVEGVLSTHVKRDGLDSTKKLERMIRKSKFRQQLRMIVIHGTTLAGFNIVDIRKLSRSLALPVIAVTKRKPHAGKVKNALKNLQDSEMRWKLLESAGHILKIGGLYAHIAGIDSKDAKELLSSFGGMPEPVRLAHVIGSGIVRGESHGKV